jgi:hypothetical protein
MSMSELLPLSEDSSSVVAHLGILQGVIQGMSANSATAKGWCTAIVSAVLAIVADKGKPDYVLLALVPTIFFFVLDAFYLRLEKGFRKAYESFVDKLHSRTLAVDDLYVVRAEGNRWRLWGAAFGSFSVWGIYLMLALLIMLARLVVRR